MIDLLDDFYHVRKACDMVQENADRKLVATIHCLLGETPDHSRIAALLFTFVLAWLSWQTFVRPFRKAAGNPSQLAFLLIALHPMVAFSYIYASQLSTTLTCLWAVGWVGFWERIRKARQHRLLWCLAGLAYSLLASLIRMESWVYAWVLFAFYWFLEREFEPRDRPLSDRIKWLLLASSPALFRPYWIEFLYSVFWHDFSVSAPIAASSPSLAETGLGASSTVVPFTDWLVTQSYAVWLYLRNFLVPHLHSFYGPSLRSWEITHSWERWLWPTASALTLILSAILSIWPKSLGSKNKISPSLRVGAMAVFVFIAPTLLLSSIPRNDWYAPSRQILGSLMLSCFCLIFIDAKWLRWVGAWVSSALLLSGVWHYSELGRFYSGERVGTLGRPSPWAELQQGVSLVYAEKYNEAILHFYRNHKSFSEEQLALDVRAGLINSLSLYYAWLSYQKMGRSEESLKILRILLKGPFYPTAVACLQDSRIAVDDCLSEGREQQYCHYFNFKAIPSLPQINPVRTNPCQKSN